MIIMNISNQKFFLRLSFSSVTYLSSEQRQKITDKNKFHTLINFTQSCIQLNISIKKIKRQKKNN